MPHYIPDPIHRLNRDLRNAAITLTHTEARFLVDSYYIMQDARIRSNGQVRSMGDEPHDILSWFADQNETLEKQIQNALDTYSNDHPCGQWLRSVRGIGPVIAAGLLAHIDITKAPTAGHIWSFAGLDPLVEWKKGQKRPWNSKLKVLCWKAGESFVKVSGHEEAFYGKVYKERKELELQRNANKEFADQAREILLKKNYGKETDAYKAYSIGMLPPAHIHARAKRYAVKLFLAHLHEIMYKDHYKKDPPLPYPIAILGHAHKIDPPQF